MGRPRESSIKKFWIAEISKKWLVMIAKGYKLWKMKKKTKKWPKITGGAKWDAGGAKWVSGGAKWDA